MKSCCAAVILVLATVALPVHAETRRLAVVVGNNAGSGARPALRYAEEDADKMARVLSELGGVAPADLFLLRGQPLSAIQAALDAAHKRIQSWRQTGTAQMVVLFYFSGHSDGQALEIGGGRLPFADLRRWLQDTGADVRLAFVDSCRSGALLGLKGGVPGSTFDIHLADNMESTGEVLITSSASDESALESAELRGSFFSHHLLSGLRGAADSSGDGLVTLSEAYQYAFSRTVSTTTNTVIGPQHPNYDYRLSGRGEVVLTHIHAPSALIELPASFERVVIAEERGGRVISEIGPQGARRLAVLPGRYVIRAWRNRGLWGTQVEVHKSETLSVAAASLQPWSADRYQGKGDGEAGIAESLDGGRDEKSELALTLAAGATRTVATSPGSMPSLRVGVSRKRQVWVTSVAMALASGEGTQLREQQAELTLGLGRWFGRGRWGLILGADLGAGTAVQRADASGRRLSGMVSLAAGAQGSVRISGNWFATLSVRAPATWVRLAGGNSVLFMPEAWAGLEYSLGR